MTNHTEGIPFSPDPKDLNASGSGGKQDLAFLHFTIEALHDRHPGLVPVTKSGKDGAIDGWAETGDARTILEAKFVGSADFEDGRKRWQEVRRHLDNNLLPDKPKQSQYRPWYRADVPIERYLFCHTARAVLAKNDELVVEIQTFFRDELAKRAGLEHLASIWVESYGWDQLLEAGRNPSFRFRWFSSYRLSGLELLDFRLAPETSFQRFLSSEHLPYYSRRQHLDLHPADEPDELALLSSLSVRNPGLIIYGAGGVGKTRLSLEIGRLAAAPEQGWLVFKARRHLRSDALEKVLREAGATRVLILLDYVEEQPHFDEVVDFIAEVNDNAQTLRMAYVATCRPAYHLARLSMVGRHEELDLSPSGKDRAQAWQNQFHAACVDQVLEEAELADDPRARELCRDHTVLAAFLLFLRNNDRLTQLEALLSERDFSDWMARSIKSSFPQGAAKMLHIRRWLALTLPLFPLNAKSYDTLREAGTEETRAWFDQLKMDGWVEREGEGAYAGWRTMHDVFADYVLLQYVAAGASDVVGELLDEAERIAQLEGALRSLQRVVGDPRFSEQPWAEVFAERCGSLPDLWRSSRVELAGSSLLSSDDLARMMEENEPFWDGVERITYFQWALARRIKKLVADPGHSEATAMAFGKWLLKLDAKVIKSANVVAMGLKLNEEAFKATAINWVEPRKTGLWTDFVYAEWCNSGLPLGEIQPCLEEWLKVNCNHLSASFPFRSWLKAGGSCDVVENSLVVWLGTHGTSAEAGFVYRAWLNAKGSVDVVEGPVKSWLSEQGTSAEAGFVYRAWLNAKGSVDVVEGPVKSWLSEQGTSAEAGFVYQAWLNAEGSVDVVEGPVKSWLSEQGTSAEAGFVYQAWLNAKGSVDVVEGPVKSWLSEQGTSAEAGFVYRAWLNAKGSVDVVEGPVKSWLSEQGTSAEAGFVYQAWLNAKGSVNVVEGPVKSWLSEQGTSAEAGFVYQAWLNAKGSVDVVEGPVKSWLSEHGTSAEAQFVYASWLNAKGSVDVVEGPVKSWLSEHGTSAEAQFVYASWLNAKGSVDVVEGSVKSWLSEHGTSTKAQFVYASWLNAKGSVDVVEGPVLAWLSRYNDSYEASFVLAPWFRHQVHPEETRRYLQQWLSRHGMAKGASFVIGEAIRGRAYRDLGLGAATAWFNRFGLEEVAGPVLLGVVNTTTLDEAWTQRLERWLAANPNSRWAERLMTARRRRGQ